MISINAISNRRVSPRKERELGSTLTEIIPTGHPGIQHCSFFVAASSNRPFRMTTMPHSEDATARAYIGVPSKNAVNASVVRPTRCTRGNCIIDVAYEFRVRHVQSRFPRLKYAGVLTRISPSWRNNRRVKLRWTNGFVNNLRGTKVM